jgi:hypothetical protein
LSFAGKWMKLDMFMLRDPSQAQKAKYHIFVLMQEYRPKIMMVVMMMTMMMIGHEFKKGIVLRGISRSKKGEGESPWGVKRIEVCYIYVYIFRCIYDSIMKPIKYCFKKGLD